MAGYLLERLVGVGGMAAVFRARDERLGRVVALKLLTGDEAVRQRFVREARAIAAVDHPHIIPVYEAGEADGVLFIAMRFVAGDDLRVVVGREGGLPVRRAAAFISAVASALDAAHAAGLVHRDVKPANMLVDVGPHRPEHVYLSDFGLARGVLSAAGLTRAGQFLGTPDYASPEQISGHFVDGHADQYALACVAYTLLSGSMPFAREEPMAVLYAHLFAPPPQVTAVRPDLPGAVDHVLARGLAKVPEDRFDSCGDLADALREALDLEPYDPTRPGRRLGQTVGSPSPAGPGGRGVLDLQPTVMAPPDEAMPEAAGDGVSGSAAAGMRGADARPQAAAGGGARPAASRAAATAPLTIPPDAPRQPEDAPAAKSSPAPSASPVVAPRPGESAAPATAATWTAVVAADRIYYDSVRPESEQDAASIEFPDHLPERRFRLAGNQVRIGRRSKTRHIVPEIDLTGPPTDTGVSRLHAVLIAGPDRNWSVVNPGSANGILVNGIDVPTGEAVQLREGDRIHLGAWTVITITRG
ncbi:MAG TPA: FHA domain-containing serine/threonine-protein kinase [Streptosporangiaceae bacterium]